MNESAARADRLGAPTPSSTPAPPSYLWQVASKPVGVRLNLEVVDRLEREVVDSFRSLTSRGSEVGGLLLGSAQNGNPTRVTIEAYELVPCDYARGPLFQLSEADTERFQRAIAQRNGSPSMRVMGFFRSHTRKNLSLDTEDLAFFSAHFREPHQVALLIRPYASKPSTGGVFIWENGAVRGESSYQEFPFRRSELERMPQPENKPVAEKPALAADPAAEPDSPFAKPQVRAQIVPIASRREIATSPAPAERPAIRSEAPVEPAPAPRFTEKPMFTEPPAPRPDPNEGIAKPPAPAFSGFSKPEESRERETTELADLVLPPLERPRRSGKMIWITAGAAAGLLVLSGALIYPGFSHKAKHAVSGQDVSALSLRVERSSGELLLSWNRDAEPIRTAAHGSLAITDGDQHENVNLDITQLRNGSIVYSPNGSDVSFQLSVVGQNSAQTSSESVRILNTHPSAAVEVHDTAPAPQKPSPAPRTETAALTPPPPPPAVQTAPAAPAVVSDAPPPAENRKQPTVRQFHAESLSQRLRPVRPTDLPEAPGLTASAAPLAVPVSLPGFNATPGLPAAPPSSRSISASPKAGGQLQQAELVSSKPPEYPLVAKQNHVQGVVVVSAVIGVDGRVKSATAVSGPTLLQKAATDAVRQWVYKPTRLNGAPVESETHVEVRFTANR